jgi:hypothetical protein
MASPDLITIDMTVQRDYCGQERSGHEAAVGLFELHGRGEVRLARAPQAYRMDVDDRIAEELDAALEEAGVPLLPQLPYVLEVTVPAEDFAPGRGGSRLRGGLAPR